jgi:hypothetical protein
MRPPNGCVTIPTQGSAARRQCWRRERIQFGLPSMANALPENDEWLRSLVGRSPLLSDTAVRRHWKHIIPWLTTADRYTLAAILLEIEHACSA